MADDITDEEGVLRRIPNWPHQYKYDKNLKRWRPSSAWFSDRKTNDFAVSVTLEKDLLEAGKGIEEALYLDNSKHKGFGLAKCHAGFLRHDLPSPQSIKRDPTEDDPFHALVIGQKKQSTRNKIAKHAEVIIEPEMEENQCRQ